MVAERTKLVIGRGKLFFNPFEPGTSEGSGELYFGNTPEFVTTRSVERLEVLDSFDGQKFAADSPVIREEHGARFTTDHIDIRNLALWYGGEASPAEQHRQSAVTETLTVRRGRFYQLGTSLSRPTGVRAVEDVKVRRADTLLSAAGNFEINPGLGRIQILPTAKDISDGDQLVVVFEQRDVTGSTVTTKPRDLFGSLRFISNNLVGENKNLFYPFVRLTPSGEIDHKGREWQKLAFDVEAQRRNALHEYVYIDLVEKVGATVAEYGIVELSGITIEQFPYWEDVLNNITNVRLPANNYPFR